MGGGVGREKDNLVNWDVVYEDKEKGVLGKILTYFAAAMLHLVSTNLNH